MPQTPTLIMSSGKIRFPTNPATTVLQKAPVKVLANGKTEPVDPETLPKLPPDEA